MQETDFVIGNIIVDFESRKLSYVVYYPEGHNIYKVIDDPEDFEFIMLKVYVNASSIRASNHIQNGYNPLKADLIKYLEGREQEANRRKAENAEA